MKNAILIHMMHLFTASQTYQWWWWYATIMI